MNLEMTPAEFKEGALDYFISLAHAFNSDNVDFDDVEWGELSSAEIESIHLAVELSIKDALSSSTVESEDASYFLDSLLERLKALPSSTPMDHYREHLDVFKQDMQGSPEIYIYGWKEG